MAPDIPIHRSYVMTKQSDLLTLRDKLRTFAEARDWDQFHSPKNLSMALMVEVAELMEHFQWLTEAQSLELAAKSKDAVSEELADILLYLIRLSDKLDVDLLQAALHKLEKNAVKYPAEQVRGSARKYSEY
jgi:dCTP diphosphatase